MRDEGPLSLEADEKKVQGKNSPPGWQGWGGGIETKKGKEA